METGNDNIGNYNKYEKYHYIVKRVLYQEYQKLLPCEN